MSNPYAEYLFNFHNVGQGLFYSGRIIFNSNERFNFIYDCGSHQRAYKDWLYPAIDNYKARIVENHHIDLLVISHLHKDHINGIERLLQIPPSIPVDTVIMPYFPLIERFSILYRSRQFIRGRNRWLFSFILDPVRYLILRGVRRIILILNNINRNTPSLRQDEELNDFNTNNMEPISPESEGKITIVEQFPLSQKDRNFIISENPHYERLIEMNRLRIIDHKNHINIGRLWEFLFFHSPVNASNLQQFANCIRRNLSSLSSNAIYQALTNSTDLLNCYEDLGVPINNTSLLMAHHPLTPFENQSFSISKGRCLPQFDTFTTNFCGNLLTGDINLKPNGVRDFSLFCDIIRFYQSIIHEIIITQIPHHGSNANWREELILFLSNCDFWVASSLYYPPRGGWNHPSRNVIDDILQNGNYFFSCNEYDSSSIFGHIRWL